MKVHVTLDDGIIYYLSEPEQWTVEIELTEDEERLYHYAKNAWDGIQATLRNKYRATSDRY